MSAGQNSGTRFGLWRVIVAGVLIVAPLHLIGQQDQTSPKGSAEDESSVFEVASIRAVPANHQGFTSISPYGTDLFVARNVTLRLLIGLAYNADDRRIEGIPSSFDGREFDVNARAEGHPKLSYEQMQPLLQNLLRDRFHLVAEHGSREVAGYALVLAKSGPKMTAGVARTTEEGAQAPAYILSNGVRGNGITMTTLAGILSRPLGGPVIDKTGLSGNYDVTLHFRASDSDDSALPSVFTAIEEQLGLKVVRQKVPVPILIVDHVDEEPTEN